MALKAGRVGVNNSQVDEFGNIKGGATPENVYTKTQCDNKFESKTHANNTYQQKNIEVPLELLGGSQLTVEASLHAIEDTFGDLQFRDNDGTPQVKTPDGDWTNFNSGGGDTLGFNIPIEDRIAIPSNKFYTVTNASGFYTIKDNVLYVDITFDKPSGSFITSSTIIMEILIDTTTYPVNNTKQNNLAIECPIDTTDPINPVISRTSSGYVDVRISKLRNETGVRVYGELKLSNDV